MGGTILSSKGQKEVSSGQSSEIVSGGRLEMHGSGPGVFRFQLGSAWNGTKIVGTPLGMSNLKNMLRELLCESSIFA